MGEDARPRHCRRGCGREGRNLHRNRHDGRLVCLGASLQRRRNIRPVDRPREVHAAGRSAASGRRRDGRHADVYLEHRHGERDESRRRRDVGCDLPRLRLLRWFADGQSGQSFRGRREDGDALAACSWHDVFRHRDADGLAFGPFDGTRPRHVHHARLHRARHRVRHRECGRGGCRDDFGERLVAWTGQR